MKKFDKDFVDNKVSGSLTEEIIDEFIRNESTINNHDELKNYLANEYRFSKTIKDIQAERNESSQLDKILFSNKKNLKDLQNSDAEQMGKHLDEMNKAIIEYKDSHPKLKSEKDCLDNYYKDKMNYIIKKLKVNIRLRLCYSIFCIEKKINYLEKIVIKTKCSEDDSYVDYIIVDEDDVIIDIERIGNNKSLLFRKFDLYRTITDIIDAKKIYDSNVRNHEIKEKRFNKAIEFKKEVEKKLKTLKDFQKKIDEQKKNDEQCEKPKLENMFYYLYQFNKINNSLTIKTPKNFKNEAEEGWEELSCAKNGMRIAEYCKSLVSEFIQLKDRNLEEARNKREADILEEISELYKETEV